MEEAGLFFREDEVKEGLAFKDIEKFRELYSHGFSKLKRL